MGSLPLIEQYGRAAERAADGGGALRRQTVCFVLNSICRGNVAREQFLFFVVLLFPSGENCVRWANKPAPRADKARAPRAVSLGEPWM